MKTITVLFILLVLWLLCGCVDRITSGEIDRAEAICNTHGGVDYINTVLGASVVCRDGVFKDLEKRELKP